MASSASYNRNKRTRQDDDSGSDSDNERFTTEDNWPRFINVSWCFINVKSASEEKPLVMMSPIAVQKGFQAIAGTLKSTKRLRDGSFLVEFSRRTQAENLLRTVTLDARLCAQDAELFQRCDQTP